MLKIASARPTGSPFPRTQISGYRVWAPPESPLRIEYSDEVLHEAARHQRGVLYGTHEEATLRVIAARRRSTGPDRGDPRISNLELLGTFAVRERGEIFLTEPDLEHLERTGGSLALVVAGTTAGFFVYEPDGSIETIRSYQEFSIVVNCPPVPPPPRAWRLQANPLHQRPAISLACLALLAASVVPIRRSRPIALTVREDAHQLRIAWTPHAFASARLEISDGAQQNWIPVSGDLSGATYLPQSGDVRIRLVAGSRCESAHFVGVDTAPERERVQRLESEAESLRAQLARGAERASALETEIDGTLAKLK